MEDTYSVATLIDSTTSKIQQLQKAFAELESHRAVSLNLKWKELEEHFHGLEKSLKRRFHELEDKEKEYKTKTMKAQQLLVNREAAVEAKEHAQLERLQDKRDGVVLAISNALEMHENASPVERLEPEVPIVKIKPPENKKQDVPYPELIKLCESMDTEGLHKFISDNRKNLAAVREEIPLALRAAANPANLVLGSLENFYCTEVDGKKDSFLLGLRRTCIMLMECLGVLLTSPDVNVSHVVSEDAKKKAKLIAEEWRPKLDALEMDASNGNSLEAHAFLQLVATFGVASDFDEKELSRLIPMVSRRRQAADLCHSLGLSDKMPGVIEVLINSGRQIDAVNLAFAFELTEQFSPVPLLKSYLKEAKKVSSPVRAGSASPSGQNEVNERELTALKAVIKCIEEHKLEDQYPTDQLQKKVLQLEKAKADNKRVTEASKPQPKRPRANGIGYAPRVTNTVAEKQPVYPRAPERYPQYMYERSYAGPPVYGTPAYNVPAQSNYFGNGYQYQSPYLY